MQLDDEHIRMKKESLANWRCHGGGPAFTRVGNRIFYPMAKLRAFVRIYASTADYGKPPTSDETLEGGKPA
jgi:hypothetical protein